MTAIPPVPGRFAGADPQPTAEDKARKALNAQLARSKRINALVMQKNGQQKLVNFLHKTGYKNLWLGADKRITTAARMYIAAGQSSVKGFAEKYPKNNPLPPSAGGQAGLGGPPADNPDLYDVNVPGEPGSDVVPATAGGGAGLGAPPLGTTPGFTPPSFTPLDVQRWAQSQAGLEFDPQIQAAQMEQAKLPFDLAAHQKELQGWYEQVAQSAGLGASNVSAQATAGVDSIKGLAAELIAAAGGNEGAAGVVGGAATVGATAIQGQGLGGSTLFQNLGTLATLEGAQQSVNQGNMANRRAGELAAELRSLTGQRAQKRTGYEMEATKYNNELLNQTWANRVAGDEAATAAALSPYDAAKAAQALELGNSQLKNDEVSRFSVLENLRLQGLKTTGDPKLPSQEDFIGVLVSRVGDGKTIPKTTVPLDTLITDMMDTLRAQGAKMPEKSAQAMRVRNALFGMLRSKDPAWVADQLKKGNGRKFGWTQ